MRPVAGRETGKAGGCAVLVFAREPVPGAVKTRLMPGLSAAQAAGFYRHMLEHALRSACLSRLGPVLLCHAPAPRTPYLEALADRHGVALCPQRGSDLGERMFAALDAATRSHGAALLTGSDCPTLDEARLRAAARALDESTAAVFVPAVDGGYVLVGCARPPPRALFDGVAWGSGAVMSETRDRLRAAGWSWRELPPLRDVDRVQDLDLLPPGFPRP